MNVPPSTQKRSFLSRPGFWYGVFLLLFNNVINFLPGGFHDKIYLWFNLSLLLLLWLWSRKYLHITNEDIGITKQGLIKSILWGVGLAALIVLPFLIILWLRPFLGLNIKPPKLPIDSISHLLWRTVIRIPLGTALFEEFLFRGILFGYFVKKITAMKTIFISSAFFMVWHFTPTFLTVRSNFGIEGILLGTGFFIILLLGGFVAGLLFGWIRYKSNNLIGCILSHAIINSMALVIMYAGWHS
jgi:membrane protease YdiL (CAAX protease family)